jgi:hypothetical protein
MGELRIVSSGGVWYQCWMYGFCYQRVCCRKRKRLVIIPRRCTTPTHYDVVGEVCGWCCITLRPFLTNVIFLLHSLLLYVMECADILLAIFQHCIPSLLDVKLQQYNCITVITWLAPERWKVDWSNGMFRFTVLPWRNIFVTSLIVPLDAAIIVSFCIKRGWMRRCDPLKKSIVTAKISAWMRNVTLWAFRFLCGATVIIPYSAYRTEMACKGHYCKNSRFRHLICYSECQVWPCTENEKFSLL